MSLRIILNNGTEYVHVDDVPLSEISLIERVEASSEDLTDILYAFTYNSRCTIPVCESLDYSIPKTTWYGDIAKTIVHNLKYS
jgi:hypothetical protein